MAVAIGSLEFKSCTVEDELSVNYEIISTIQLVTEERLRFPESVPFKRSRTNDSSP